MQNLKENWLVPCKSDRNLVNFHASSWKSGNLSFDKLFLSKAYEDLDEKVEKSYVSWHWRVRKSLKNNWLKKYRSVISHGIEKRSKLLKKTDSFLKKNMKNLVNFNESSGKSEKLHFDSLAIFVESM